MLKIAFNTILGIILIVIWSRFVDLSQVSKILQTVDPKFVATFVFFFGLAGALRGLRFKFLLNKYRIPAKDVIMLTYLAQFLSFMIPLRIGELSKSIYLTSQFNLPLGKAVVWVFIDRFLDFLMIILTIAILLQFIPTILPAKFLPIILIVLVGFSLSFLIATVLSAHLKWLSAFEIIRQNRLRFVGLLLFTLPILVVDGMIWWSAFASLGINLGLFKSMLGNGLAALTFLIPSAPGYVGSAEASGLAVFGGVLGLEANLASAGTILMHIITTVFLLVFGLISLYLLKFDLGLVWKKFRGY